LYIEKEKQKYILFIKIENLNILKVLFNIIYIKNNKMDPLPVVSSELLYMVFDGLPTIIIPRNTPTYEKYEDARNAANNARRRGATADEQAIADQIAENALNIFIQEQDQLWRLALNIIQQQGLRLQILFTTVKFE
jgi:hypothetical protein